MPKIEELPLPSNPVSFGGAQHLTSSETLRNSHLARFDRLITAIATALGLDRAVAFTLLARGWSSIAGLVSLTLITRHLTRAEQGYYYTFYSLVALQIVFELGFSVVLLQTASHEAAHLTICPDGTIAGPPVAHARLASVLKKAIRWYAVTGLLMACALYPIGHAFFHRQDLKQIHGNPVAWGLPWLLAVAATCCTFQIDPLFSFLEGCGYVWNVTRIRFAQAVFGSLLAWAALSSGHGLLAPGCMIAGQAFVGAIFVHGKRRLLFGLLRHPHRHGGIDWANEVWPFQWRIAISWLCGYLTFQLFNPILLAYRGPIEAGQMGMSMNICGTLSGMGVAWMSTKAAPLGRLIARKDYGTLDRTFFRAVTQSVSAAALAFAAVWLIFAYLRDHRFAIGLRVLPAIPLALLFAGHVANVVVFAEALYLRAHKQEKFMVNSIAAALWMAPSALFAGRAHGAYGIAICYFLGTLCIGIGYGTWTFIRYRSLWHG